MHGVIPFSARHVGEYAWSRLGAFENVDYTSAQIEDRHGTPKAQRTNVRKQAAQIKYCLLQAREYANAARAVSLATRPVLLYYCAMSLALCEILFKQDGRFRLERLREQHNCHGLTFSLCATPEPTAALSEAAALLTAKPQLDSAGEPRGTFEVWRRGAGEYPVGGERKEETAGSPASTTSYTMLFTPSRDYRASLGAQITLLDCLCHLPSLRDLLQRLDVRSRLVRATPVERWVGKEITSQLIIHPTSKDVLDAFLEQVLCPADAINSMTFHEIQNGLVIYKEGTGDMSLPPATSLTTRESYFACHRDALNEFGYTYAALHMAGNFARYYPDQWLRHIEVSSPLAMAVSEVTTHAFERLPILTLSEMTGAYCVERG